MTHPSGPGQPVLPHVLWLGGPPGSGKTTVARALARRHGLRLYSADTRTWEHRDRALAAGSVAARRWESRTVADRWALERGDGDLVDESLHVERGPMVLDDLASLPAAPLVIAEGTVLPPAALSAGIAGRSHALWLAPTPAFQAAAMTARGDQPGHARLYGLLAAVIEREIAAHDAPTLVVDASRTFTDTLAAVESRFGSAIAAGPVAGSPAERRGLLREANDAVAGQVRGFHARPWASGDAEAVERDFACECGDPACTADVTLTVGAWSRGPALAPGHTVR